MTEPVRRRKRTVPRPTLLFEGDLIEYAVTAELKTPKGTVWVKTGGQTQVREGETADGARERLKAFCVSAIDQDMQEMIK